MAPRFDVGPVRSKALALVLALPDDSMKLISQIVQEYERE